MNQMIENDEESQIFDCVKAYMGEGIGKDDERVVGLLVTPDEENYVFLPLEDLRDLLAEWDAFEDRGRNSLQ